MKKILLILSLLLIPLTVFAADSTTDGLVEDIMNSSLLGTIRNAESTMLSLLNNNILSLTGGMGATVTLIGISLFCYVAYIAFLMQQAKGKEVKAATNHLFKIMIIIAIGGTVLPVIDQLGSNLENSFKTGITNKLDYIIKETSNDKYITDRIEVLEEAATDAKVNIVIDAVSSSTIGNLVTGGGGILMMANYARKFWRWVTDADDTEMKTIALNAGVTKLANDRSVKEKGTLAVEDVLKNKNETIKLLNAYDINKSLLDWKFEEIVAYVLEIIGALLSLLMRVIQKLLLACFKLGFGIAMSVSLFPKFEKTWEKYLRSYVSVTLWGVTLSIVATLGSIVSHAMPQNPWTSCVLLFVVSCFYLMTPAINSMLFGSEASTSGMTNQIIGSGATVFAAASKGVNLIKGGGKSKSGGGGKSKSGGGSSSNPDGQQGV